jgi:hypothetical protein
MQKYYTDTSKKPVSPMNSVNIACKSFKFNIYDKHSQMEMQKFIYPDIKDSVGVVRFEIQTLYPKLYSIKTKENISDLYDFLIRSPEDGRKLFERYFKLMFCNGRYVKYDKAVSSIEGSGYLPNAKQNMLNLLLYTSRHSSLYKGINELYRNGYEEHQVRGIIKKFDKLDVNPVTISNNSEIDEMPNPLDLINDTMYYIWAPLTH